MLLDAILMMIMMRTRAFMPVGSATLAMMILVIEVQMSKARMPNNTNEDLAQEIDRQMSII